MSTPEGFVESAEDSYDRVFLAGIAGHERSQQKIIGPSGLGTTCPRKLAYGLAQSDRDRRPHTELRQTMGTAGHAWAEKTFQEFGDGEWLTERRVYVGDIVTPSGSTEIWGTSDLFHVPSGFVVDHKFPGNAGVKKMRLHGMGQGYRVQSHLYGCGYRNAGYIVRGVAISAIPAAGEWKERVWLEEEFNPQIAEAALRRAGKLMTHIEAYGLEAVLEKLKPVDDFCRRCEFARPGKDRPTCPTANPQETQTTLSGLLRKKR